MENSTVLREWFARVDSANTGNITAPQLKIIDKYVAFCRMYDFDRNGTMSFEEFVALNKFLLKVKTLIMKLQFLVQHFLSVLFNKPSQTERGDSIYLRIFSCPLWGRGYIVPDDVHEALVKIGFSLDSPAFYTVCESFDQKKKGMFRLDDFISLCIFLQSARNLFNSFDTAKQGRVTLDLNQFVFCTANCRI
ncbi:hypothetical protein ACE6H2_027867 [Prunus campanulata]